MSRLDEIKARYGWCERCANHDPRDRRDHGHLRSQTEIDALWLVSEIERLTAERDDMAWQRTQALNERDALAARVAQVKALADHWAKRAASDYEAGGTLTWGAADVHFSAVLRDALAGSIGQEAAPDAGHKCEPYYSRAECGRCGWQEQWCATCSRQMCGCATDAMGADQ